MPACSQDFVVKHGELRDIPWRIGSDESSCFGKGGCDGVIAH